MRISESIERTQLRRPLFMDAGASFPFFFPSKRGMERREAPAGLRDPLWRSLAIGPAGRLVRPPPPLVWGRRLPALHRRQACAVCACLTASDAGLARYRPASTTLYRAPLPAPLQRLMRAPLGRARM